MTKVAFHPAASGELRETASYYEHHVTGLGEEFLAEVERVCGLLAAYPTLGVPYDAGDRRALLRRFPFALIYRITNNELTIIAVAHTKRRPGYWRHRT